MLFDMQLHLWDLMLHCIRWWPVTRIGSGDLVGRTQAATCNCMIYHGCVSLIQRFDRLKWRCVLQQSFSLTLTLTVTLLLVKRKCGDWVNA